MKHATRGRPRKPPEERMGERIEVRATAAEKRRLEQAAQRVGMDLSDWIRDRLQTAATADLAAKPPH